MTRRRATSADAWRQEMMRLTAFPAPGPLSVDAAAWWPSLFGVPPEKATHNLKTAVKQLRGRVDDAFMIVTENPVSYELRRLPGDPAEPPVPPDSLARYETGVPAFREVALRWLKLENCPPLRRLAFGCTLVKPAASYESAQDTLNECLPGVTIDRHSSDFLYQINRRRPSSVTSGLPLNRLSKWSIQQTQDVVLDSHGTLTKGLETLACRVELDINCVPSAKPLPREDLGALFEELVHLAVEISRDGDIP